MAAHREMALMAFRCFLGPYEPGSTADIEPAAVVRVSRPNRVARHQPSADHESRTARTCWCVSFRAQSWRRTGARPTYLLPCANLTPPPADAHSRGNGRSGG